MVPRLLLDQPRVGVRVRVRRVRVRVEKV